jgi:hypothetical protein
LRFEEIGLSLESWMAYEGEHATAAARASLDDDSFDAAWELGRALTLDEAVALALGSSTSEPGDLLPPRS